ncbi:AMP-binding protein [Ruegeria halocynthiae]|uniref:AMP-binding protein n=1 Tax=Ruegeria halocynthiae TaxID=985054 RepID=UPI0006900180|nr:AMP-binding protein [Ruegeria halocynthiae]
MSNDITTFAGLIESQAEKLADETFVLFEDQEISFATFNAQVNRVANGLRDLGCGKDTGVSIMMENAPEWLYVHFGVQKVNAYSVPVNTGLKGEGLKHIISHSDSSVLIIDDTFLDVIADIRDDLTKVKYVIVNRTGATAGDEDELTLQKLMANSSEDNPQVAIENGPISTILYTSGTTGLPKGVVSRYREFHDEGIFFFLQPRSTLYTCLPLFHANALEISTIHALSGGHRLALAKRFSASRFFDDIRRYKVDTFNALGAMITILMKQPERKDDADNPATVVISAACPVSEWEAFESRFGVKLFEGYGAVDGGGYNVFNVGTSPVGSVGKPSVPYRLVDDEGNDVAQGESGELIFEIDDPERRSVEYYKNPEASSKLVKDGWFYTGDLLHADADGNLFFDDRKTDSLRRRGENVSAWEVERDINKHDAVLESAVVGVKSDLGEDDVMAFIQLKPGTSVTPDELIAHCKGLMAEFMVPRYLEFRDEFPKTGTHRTQKAVLKKEGVGPNTWDREKA